MDSVQSVVLLVEDNESHALLTIRGLSQQNIDHKIIHLTDGQAALDYLYRRGAYSNRRLSPRPDLVLLDLRLPKIDGLDVLQEIKNDEDLQSIPVVVLTSSMAEPDIVRAYMYHVNSYLVKSLDYDEFRREMNDVARYWLTWNINPL